MEQPLRIAVIGSGARAAALARLALQEGAELAAIAEDPRGLPEAQGDPSARHIGEPVAREPGQSSALRALVSRGHIYPDPEAMLAAERPAAAIVASPAWRKIFHAGLAVRAGLHVLVEPPVSVDATRSPRQLLREARRVISAAEKARLVVATMTPHVSLVPRLRKLGELTLGPRTGIWQFGMKFEAPRVPGASEFEGLWLELGSHPLALFCALVPHGALARETLEVSVQQSETRVAFDSYPPADQSGAEPCHAVVVVGRSSRPECSLEINGFRIFCRQMDEASAAGHKRIGLRVGEVTAWAEDPERLTLRAFLKAARGESCGSLSSGHDVARVLTLLYEVIGSRRHRGGR